ncbi:MAG: sigma-70 family RNA polymerase sigma factor [Bacteroidales bacterium]|nr:sigma-70 family RNA polymerase sigma factor [Bacteroidales bacterium]
MKSNSENVQDLSGDENLILAYRKEGDPGILGILYKKYMHMVYGVGMKYLKNREESQDLVMQVFEVLVKDVMRFEIRNFKSWLYAITKNQCLMRLRGIKKIRNSQDMFLPEEFMESTAIVHPVDETEDDAMLTKLALCMEKLNEMQRTCIEQFYYQQKCYKVIAAEMKVNENKVKSYIQNGKRNLKICLENYKELAKNG